MVILKIYLVYNFNLLTVFQNKNIMTVINCNEQNYYQ